MSWRDRISDFVRQAAGAAAERVGETVEGLRAERQAERDAEAMIRAALRGEDIRNYDNAGRFAKADVPATGAPGMGSTAGAAAHSSAGGLRPQEIDIGSPADDPKALYWDPFSLVEQLGYKEKPTAITYGTLAAMVWKTPIIGAIIQTRVNQVSAFTTPQRHRFETGFRVKLRDQEAKPTRADKRRMRELEEILETTGYTDDPRGRDSFETFVRKITRDSLTYDQLCFEIVPGRNGKPSQWYAVDAATIRRADTHHLYPDSSTDRVKYVQIYDQTVIAEFTDQELCFAVRNPRTDIRGQGYGTAEAEMMVSTITQILWGMQYNAAFFSQGSVQKGLLNLKGAIPEKQLRAFRRQWYQMVAGVENAWRTPVVNAEDVQWISMHASNRDMEFSAWLDFLIKVACATFAMDPMEVNFKYGSGGGQKSMFDSANKSKLIESKDRGLKPLLRFLSRVIDRYVIWPLDPKFSFEFVGLDAQTPKEIADLNTQRVRSMYMVDEIRAENDLAPLPDGMGEVILDANWLAAKRFKEEQELQAAQQAAQLALAASGGVPDASGGAPGGAAPGTDPTLGGKLDGVKGNEDKGVKPATPKQQQELKQLTTKKKEDKAVEKPSTNTKSLVFTLEDELKKAGVDLDLEL